MLCESRLKQKRALQNPDNGGQLVFVSSERDFNLLCPQHSLWQEKGGKLIELILLLSFFMNEVKPRAVPRSKN